MPWGNPSARTHIFGQHAKKLIEEARINVAALLNVDLKTIYWTSGATEANNLAIKGVAQFYARRGKHIITSQFEHKSVLDSCHQLEKEGFVITYLKPNSASFIEVADVEKALRADTILVSIMAANNEIGTLQDLQGIGDCCRQRGVFFHADVVQAAGKISLDLDRP